MLIFSVSSSMSGNGKLILYNGIGSKVLDLHLKLEAASLHAVDITKLSAGYYTLVYQAKGMGFSKTLSGLSENVHLFIKHF